MVGHHAGCPEKRGQIDWRLGLDPDQTLALIVRTRNQVGDQLADALSRLQDRIKATQNLTGRLNGENPKVGGQRASIQNRHPRKEPLGGPDVRKDGSGETLGNCGDRCQGSGGGHPIRQVPIDGWRRRFQPAANRP